MPIQSEICGIPCRIAKHSEAMQIGKEDIAKAEILLSPDGWSQDEGG